MLIGQGHQDRLLTEHEVRELMSGALSNARLDGRRILIIIPDRTRTAPIPLMFRLFFEYLGPTAACLDYLIALGTHQPMTEPAIESLVGIDHADRVGKYRRVNIFNHRWDLPEQFVSLGTISAEEIGDISEGRMRQEVDVRINRLVLDYEQIIICGPTFPHEVVGFSGGNKYFVPGIAGGTIINLSHWLGALITSYEIIGAKYTPVRRLIDRAAGLIDRPKLCFSMVVKGGSLAGLYIGCPEESYGAAADLSAKVHVVWLEKPVRRVISVIPAMYDDLWTAAKGMYKLEPAIADGGEVVIYAPHITEVSYTHGRLIDEIGYHVRDYFLKQWDRFKHYPGGVIAHSTHLRGIGEYDDQSGVESPRIQVTLATQIPRERCRRLNLEYMEPESVRLEDWQNREQEGILVVPKAGEMLYRLTTQQVVDNP